jgi:1-acyl-sn-glycerol-3-phosphate acyltransferase
MRMHWVYYFGRVLIHILLFPVAFLRVKGRENIPGPGPYLIVGNHNHIADPPIIGTCIKLKSVFMAKSELWDNAWSRFWVENYGAFPIHRGGVDREAIRHAEKWAKRGVSIVMFPEGTRSRNGQMQPALPGSVLLAARLGLPILPVGITGSDKLRNLKWAFWHHPTITVNIGKPFYLPETEGKLTKEKRNKLLTIIMKHIADLLPTEYHGVYAREKNAQD